MTYTICKLKNRAAAALYAMSNEMRSQGVPPHWLSYFAVADY